VANAVLAMSKTAPIDMLKSPCGSEADVFYA
jgi:hypothetical protein